MKANTVAKSCSATHAVLGLVTSAPKTPCPSWRARPSQFHRPAWTPVTPGDAEEVPSPSSLRRSPPRLPASTWRTSPLLAASEIEEAPAHNATSPFSDSQHGTAIVVLFRRSSALKIVGKKDRTCASSSRRCGNAIIRLLLCPELRATSSAVAATALLRRRYRRRTSPERCLESPATSTVSRRSSRRRLHRRSSGSASDVETAGRGRDRLRAGQPDARRSRPDRRHGCKYARRGEPRRLPEPDQQRSGRVYFRGLLDAKVRDYDRSLLRVASVASVRDLRGRALALLHRPAPSIARPRQPSRRRAVRDAPAFVIPGVQPDMDVNGEVISELFGGALIAR